MSKKGHIPIRTCIGCRKKKKKEELIWMNQSPEGVVGLSRNEPHRGRGFYLCPDLLCLNMAKKRSKKVRFLEAMDFKSPLVIGSFDRGGRE